ncbi:hypothetical protein OHU23_40635 (plasmid) [Streptomyces virginiae]|uniref:hypothetical protein n=1 Tax=Streptomyces virginiae TaxID=1961 RepID=UPI00324BB93A
MIAWYSEQIMEQRRAAEPDRVLLEGLLAARRVCVEDQRALGEATAEEVAGTLAAYAARYRELTSP